MSMMISVIGKDWNQFFKGEDHNLWQRQEIKTAEKLSVRHDNFTQGAHVVRLDNAF